MAKKVYYKKTPEAEINQMKNDVLAVNYGRQAHVLNDFPELKREDFSTEAKYIEALQKQYKALRQQEYEYICLQQSYDTYLASRCVNDLKCRSVMFSSVTGIAEGIYNFVDEEEPTSVEVINQDIEDNPDFSYSLYWEGDSAVSVNNAAIEVSDCHQTNAARPVSKSHHCAMTGLRIVTGISNRLGYSGDNNFADGAWAGANAGLIHGRNAGTGVTGCKGAICNGKYSVPRKGKTLKQLILSGEIGPGDIISTGKDNGSGNSNKVSGYHVLTVASINKDANGNIIGYTLMDNNGGPTKTRLEAHSINDKFSSNQVLYTKTHQWANDMFSKEMKGKSAEELQQMIAQSKERMCSNIIPDLTRNELTLMCDETYLETCGITLKNVNRAPGLKDQQVAFRQFYSKQNASLMEVGRGVIAGMSGSNAIIGSEREATKAIMRMDANKHKYIDLEAIVREYDNEQNLFERKSKETEKQYRMDFIKRKDYDC